VRLAMLRSELRSLSLSRPAMASPSFTQYSPPLPHSWLSSKSHATLFGRESHIPTSVPTSHGTAKPRIVFPFGTPGHVAQYSPSLQHSWLLSMLPTTLFGRASHLPMFVPDSHGIAKLRTVFPFSTLGRSRPRPSPAPHTETANPATHVASLRGLICAMA
jgi:hypothetical protein